MNFESFHSNNRSVNELNATCLEFGPNAVTDSAACFRKGTDSNCCSLV